MAFSESLKAKVRKRSMIRCCMCRALGVEIHHIIPQEEGGEDTEENAAPLCPSCHETYGANPKKRKMIKEARDIWYDVCAEAFIGSNELKEMSRTLSTLATKEDIERLAIRNSTYAPGASEDDMQSSPDGHRYSFVREEFIHPLIIRELLGWISDRAETISSVNLASANRSNRFYGEFNVKDRGGRLWVKWESSERESFEYSHVITTPSGVEIIECYDWGGGSGVFGSVGLFGFESDRALGVDKEGKISTQERIILKNLGSIGLGDRYSGEVKYEDGFLVIGPDNGWFKRGEEAARKIPVR